MHAAATMAGAVRARIVPHSFSLIVALTALSLPGAGLSTGPQARQQTTPTPTRLQAGPPITASTRNMVIKPQFDEADSFSEGLAPGRIGGEQTGKWGYIYR
jgi:hypothetical protein